MLIILLLNVAVIRCSPDLDSSYRTKSSDEYVPCERGWYYFRDKCYRVATRAQRLNWTTALNKCKAYGADLVSIQSKEEQEFVMAYLILDVKYWGWIGLNDRDKEGDFKWSDGSVFNYSNWDAYQPDGTDYYHLESDCVHIVYYPNTGGFGTWNDRSCGASEFGLCEKEANPKRKSPDLKYCSPEEGGGWKYENSCFHIVTEMESWKNAERHCKSRYNGHLLTIRHMLQDYFIEYALPSIENEVWIGIEVQDQLQQKWTSGWYVSYERFSKEERYEQGTCVARKSRTEWIMTPCSRQLPFICEVSKESPPVLNPPPLGAHCPKDLDDWRDLGGDYCYYIRTTNALNFYDANFECQRRGGDLLSIHSREEADILLPFIRDTGETIHTGLIRYKENNEETFGWTDKSALDYQMWAHGEPNRMDEKCVEALTSTMEWRDNVCENRLHYICSVKKIVPHSSLCQKSADCKNYCVAPSSYLDGLLSQCSEAKEIL